VKPRSAVAVNTKSPSRRRAEGAADLPMTDSRGSRRTLLFQRCLRALWESVRRGPSYGRKIQRRSRRSITIECDHQPRTGGIIRANTAPARGFARAGAFVSGEQIQMHRILVALACVVSAAGCQMSTGVLPAGPDTYTMRKRIAPILGGSLTAQQNALTEANAYCAQQGRQFVPSDMSTPSSANPYGPTDYSVTFRCVPPDDPALARFRLERSPNFILEQRNR
jgi:hypothetical protein